MSDVVETMRADWDRRAREDANYYVAFGRRGQDEIEFFASAADVIRALESELKRKAPEFWLSGRALEIGCGPGRLMRCLHGQFAEIHGVDISEEMIRRARHNLQNFPHTYPQHAPDSDLHAFSDATFAFVYSYAVFQHIPSREVVLGYLREAARVLTPGGLFVFQINGLDGRGHLANTWNGARFRADEMFEFAAEHGLRLLALNGQDTQYMWVTLEKAGPFATSTTRAPFITSITNAHTGEAAIPNGGRYGAVSVWIENLPASADLLSLTARVDGQTVRGCFISAGIKSLGDKRQFNFMLPGGVRTGLVPVEVWWHGEPLCAAAWARVFPQGPRVPRIVSLTDGTNLTSVARIETGYGKIALEEIGDAATVRIRIDGEEAEDVSSFCVDPLPDLYEFNFRVPRRGEPGVRVVEVSIAGRKLAPVSVEVV